ncbi:MAG TPA: histidine phosphatase family protein [Thermomicrobiales bacterium]|nr:histidine phosphatase family protein [Thermomicrobiales bacterium]
MEKSLPRSPRQRGGDDRTAENDRIHEVKDINNATTEQTTIYLVRHGETDWNRTGKYQGSSDIPLNALGEQQAAQLGDYLRGNDLAPRGDAIVSSPLSRAFATARAIGDALGIDEITTDADLQERSYGVAEGLTLAEREARWPEGNWDGLEEWDNVATRAMRALDKVVAEHAGEHVFVVCHGGLINAILAVLSHDEIGTGKTTIVNTSITTLLHTDEGWRIVAYNETPHLDLDPVPAD